MGKIYLSFTPTPEREFFVFKEVKKMLANPIRIMYFDPEKGWIEDSFEESNTLNHEEDKSSDTSSTTDPENE